MAYIDDLLGQDESIQLVAHRHIIFLLLHTLPFALATLLLWVGAGLVQRYVDSYSPWLALALVVVSLVPLAITIYRFFVWKLEEYVVTNYRILQVEGIINKQTLDSALEKVNDVLMTQSLAGRMFGYGNIDILTGSERGINSLTGIADPFAFKRALLNAKMQLDDPGEGWRRSSTADHARLLSALADLRDSGVISGDEYEQRREQLSRG
ncbi:MAG TPA: PH domain-containing protein [Thermomicrobiales bacterium]|nr:PH domain-containing protein [Thermomicrobiales bacterium]